MPHLFYCAFKHFFHSLWSLFICISATVQSHILLCCWTRVLTTRSESLPFASARFPSFLPSFLFQWILCTFLHRYTLSLDAFSILPRKAYLSFENFVINRLHGFNVILIVEFESRDFDSIRNYFNRNSIFETTRLNVATSDDPPRCDNTRTDKRGKERLVAFEEFAFLFALLFVKSHSIAIQLTKSSAYVTLSDCW